MAFSPISSAVLRPTSSLMSVSTTVAPSRASTMASALPRPSAAPVTMQTLPSTRPMSVSL
jgi:hypothetical protein